MGIQAEKDYATVRFIGGSGGRKNLLSSKQREHRKALAKFRKIVASLPDKDGRPLYEPRAPNPWDRKNNNFFRRTCWDNSSAILGKLYDCLIVPDLPGIGFLFLHPRYRRDQLN